MSYLGVESYNSNTYEKQIYAKQSNKSDTFQSTVSAFDESSPKTEEILGLCMIKDDNANSYHGVKAQYDESSTYDNPVLLITSNCNGKTSSYKVEINKVDPQHATELEMFALCAYEDSIGGQSNSKFGSFQKLRSFNLNARMNGYIQSSSQNDDFFTENLDWSSMCKQMMQDYYQAHLIGQFNDCGKLLNIFSKYTK